MIVRTKGQKKNNLKTYCNTIQIRLLISNWFDVHISSETWDCLISWTFSSKSKVGKTLDTWGYYRIRNPKSLKVRLGKNSKPIFNLLASPEWFQFSPKTTLPIVILCILCISYFLPLHFIEKVSILILLRKKVCSSVFHGYISWWPYEKSNSQGPFRWPVKLPRDLLFLCVLGCWWYTCTLPKTNRSHPKMDGCKTILFPFGFRPVFRCKLLVSGCFREGHAVYVY